MTQYKKNLDQQAVYLLSNDVRTTQFSLAVIEISANEIFHRCQSPIQVFLKNSYSLCKFYANHVNIFIHESYLYVHINYVIA